MRLRNSVLLYTALGLLANAATAQSVDLADLRDGDMRKLTIHSDPIAGSDVVFTSEDGDDLTLADFNGQYILLNFWANKLKQTPKVTNNWKITSNSTFLLSNIADPNGDY